MLEELINIHQQIMSSLDGSNRRFLYDQVQWDDQAICIHGARGVGKTTMLCQYLLERYKTVNKALYISGDNIHVLSNGLLTIATKYFDLGGEAIFIDEIHKYPNWSIEIKNIIDTYRKKQIIFSGSSAMELKNSKVDLSRRVLYHELPCLSFREYLQFSEIKTIKPYKLNHILKHHVKIAEEFIDIPIIKHFNDYLAFGSYPFYLENKKTYLLKLNNVIEKVISEDIPATKTLKPNTLIILKKLLWLIATATCLVPNIDKISKNLGVTRDIIYNGLAYLEQAGLIMNIYPKATGMKLIRKPGKIFLNNTNLLHAINGTLKLTGDKGSMRETYFCQQLRTQHSINTHDVADFIVDDTLVFEVGGKSKTNEQIKQLSKSYLAIDDIKIGFGNRIPLYMFGLLY